MTPNRIKPEPPKRVGPVPPPDPEGNGAHPVFAFMQCSVGFGLGDLSDEHKLAILKVIESKMTMTWAQIVTGGHNRMGSHTVRRSAFTSPIPDWVQDDDTLISISFGQSMQRIIGVRRSSLFLIGWFDPNGNAYDHGRR